MTAPCDYPGEDGGDDVARTSVTDDAVEAVLAGRDDDVPDELADVATVLRAVRVSAERPSAPSADLMDLFAAGAEPQPAPDEERDPRPVAVGHSWIGAAFQRVGALGVAAKLGLVAVLGVAGVTGAGATGALPGGLQDRVADAVGAVSPFEFPSSADDRASEGPGVGEDVSEDAADPADPGVEGPDIADEVTRDELTPAERDVPVSPAHPDRGLGEADDTPAGERFHDEAEDAGAGEQAPGEPPAGSETGDDHDEDAPAGPDAGEDRRDDPPAGPAVGDPDRDADADGSVSVQAPDRPGAAGS